MRTKFNLEQPAYIFSDLSCPLQLNLSIMSKTLLYTDCSKASVCLIASFQSCPDPHCRCNFQWQYMYQGLLCIHLSHSSTMFIKKAWAHLDYEFWENNIVLLLPVLYMYHTKVHVLNDHVQYCNNVKFHVCPKMITYLISIWLPGLL